jgi:hypothetical protein
MDTMCTKSIFEISSLPLSDFLNGRIQLGECLDRGCLATDIMDGISNLNLAYFKCCVLVHPYCSLSSVAVVFCLFCLLAFYVLSSLSRRSISGGVYTLQVRCSALDAIAFLLFRISPHTGRKAVNTS